MAFKMKGLYAPEKREHSGKAGKPIEQAHLFTLEAAAKLLAEVEGATRGLPNRIPTDA
jgi:hypothetical protein